MIGIIVVFALLLLMFLLLRVARGQSETVRDYQELERQTVPVDLIAFRNLADPAEEDFLRRHLSAPEFRSVQRARLLAMADYVRRAAQNAAVVIRLGEAGRRSAVPDVRAAAREVVERGVRLRIYALLVLCKLYLKAIFPGIRLSLAGFSNSYEAVAGNVAQLVQLDNPAYATRVWRSL